MNDKTDDITLPLERKLTQHLLLDRAVPGDRLMLADSTLLAALDGSRPLTRGEREALQQSPLTLRRFRRLSQQSRASAASSAANDDAWLGSSGMLRAAAGTAALQELVTDDRCWTLHFLPQQGPGAAPAWQVILKLADGAPFAPRLIREQALISVVDGGGAIILQGRLDADGECEHAWPFTQAPAPHFHQCGAGFSVMPVAP
jgi:hypothetical protein